ncbi:hypothetical protein G9A89_018217 [Geosiphon pyriformis]|nr:hypothetical protein G9A89_018217 [Geosiphon pyriformis]
MDMTIELVQKIEDNQRIHLGSTLPVFASAFAMVSASQMTATSFATHIQDPNEQLIDKLTANFAWLLELLAQAIRDNQQLQRSRFESCFNQPQQPSYQRQQNYGPPKKKAKVDFILNSNKVLTSTVDNNEPPKTKVFKNLSKLEPPKIVQKSGPYSVVKNLMKTPAHITFGQLITHLQFRKDLRKSLISKKKTPKTNKCLCQAGLADNSNVTPLICKAQVVGYFIDLILNSRSSVSVIAKYFLKIIGKKIDEPSIWSMTNVYGDKKKGLNIAKAVSVHINGISIKTNMEVSEAKKYTIIVGNKWLKKAKALLNYELCKLTIRCGEKPIVVKCHYWTTSPVTKQNQEEKQSDESDDDENNDKEDQEEQKKTVELTYTIFTSNSKPLDNVKANKEEIMPNIAIGDMVLKFCLIYYKDWEPISLIPREELKEVQKSFENKPPEIQLLVVKQRKSSLEEKK